MSQQIAGRPQGSCGEAAAAKQMDSSLYDLFLGTGPNEVGSNEKAKYQPIKRTNILMVC